MADVRLYPHEGESILKFVSRCPPSSTTTTNCSWIQVNSMDRSGNRTDQNDGNVGAYVAASQAVLKENQRLINDPQRTKSNTKAVSYSL
jgi:hypothetical protein